MDKDKIDLIKKAINNSKSALVQLIKEEQDNIYSTLYYLKKDDNELNDLVQIVLIKLYKKITDLKNPLYFKTWLNQIIVNSYYDYIRKNKKRNLEISTDEINSTDKIKDTTLNPQDVILYSEIDKVIKKTIENLPLHYKIPITLREIQGLSYQDISNITKISIGTVKSRIARARTIIQDKVEKYAKG